MDTLTAAALNCPLKSGSETSGTDLLIGDISEALVSPSACWSVWTRSSARPSPGGGC